MNKLTFQSQLNKTLRHFLFPLFLLPILSTFCVTLVATNPPLLKFIKTYVSHQFALFSSHANVNFSREIFPNLPHSGNSSSMY